MKTPRGFYIPFGQAAPARASFAVRVSERPEALAEPLRTLVARIAPELPVNDLRTMPQLIRSRTRLYRLQGPLFIGLGLAAMALTLAGLYSVVSYTASLRTAEFGVRATLGAGQTELMWRAVGDAAIPGLLGALAGLPVGLFLIKGMDRLLFMVDPWSPWVTLGSVLTLAVGTMIASLAPALRASRVDLVTVLKSD
ncbi:MAG: hypothetical protein O2992_13830 [Gemmatimonadetes bacterium]|nr:hypothetical protein [Gemmatimonadota bacterium]